MTLTDDEMITDLKALAAKFHEGWHDGIEIDASELVLLHIVIDRLAGLTAIPRDGNEPQPKWNYPEQALQYIVAMAKGRARAGLAAIPREPVQPKCIDEWACMMPGDCSRVGKCLADDDDAAQGGSHDPNR